MTVLGWVGGKRRNAMMEVGWFTRERRWPGFGDGWTWVWGEGAVEFFRVGWVKGGVVVVVV